MTTEAYAAPVHVTTVDQHIGNHPTGMREMQLKEIRTSFSDYDPDHLWAELSDDDRETWDSTLADIHAARVEMAELDCDTREAAETLLCEATVYGCEVTDEAEFIRNAIAEAKGTPTVE
jgi:hypothetical protein